MALNKMDIVDVNLNTGNIHRSFLSHTIGLSDNNADSFGVRVFRDGNPVDLSGGWVQGFFRNPMGENIALTEHGTISGNTAYVTLPQACYNYDGQFTLAIKIVSPGSTNTVTMRIVDGTVDNTNTGGAVAPTETVPTYQEVLAVYDDMLAATTAATTAATNVGSIVAAAYSTSATYAVGDYCTKDGNLYRCTTAITTAESWTAAHWTQTKMGSDVSDLKSAFDELDDFVCDYIPTGVNVNGITGITSETGHSGEPASNGIYLSSVANYDSYYIVSDKECDIYFNTGDSSFPAYVAFCSGDNVTGTEEYSSGDIRIYCSDPIRYRNIENNLPSENNKLHINVGDLICITVTAGTTVKLYGYAEQRIVDENFKEQILSDVQSNKMILKYNANTGITALPTGLEIYIPVKKGYVGYMFYHCERQQINADVWIIDTAKAYNKSMTYLFDITTEGEWACAIKLDGRPDFSGGRAHGDEIQSSYNLFVDGKSLTPASITEEITADNIVFVQTSTLYDPLDSVTAVAEHTIEYCFTNTEKQLEIRQTVKWLGSYNLDSAYLAMFPIAKTCSEYVYTDVSFTPFLPSSEQYVANVKRATTYKASKNIKAVFGIEKYPSGLTGGNRFLVTDNNGGNYNKQYYIVAKGGGQVVTNDLWQAECYYQILIGN